MSEKSKLNNSFCWIELACHDMESCKEFYGSLMKWKFHDLEEEGGVYSHIKLANKNLVGALYEFELPEEYDEKVHAKVPSFWGSYIAVSGIDSLAKKAEKLGGHILSAPTDIGNTARISVIQDPVGAIFGLWEAKKLEGFSDAREEVGSSGWNELLTTNVESSVNFYTKLFPWKVEKHSFLHEDYVMFVCDKKRIAGMRLATGKLKDHAPHWLIYFNVNDCDKSTKMAIEKGAKVLFAPTKAKGIGHLSIMSDSEGALFAMIKYDPTTV